MMERKSQEKQSGKKVTVLGRKKSQGRKVTDLILILFSLVLCELLI